MTMEWKFENAAPVIGSITEGNCWNGKYLLYSNISMNRILKYDPSSKLVSVYCKNTEGINGLNYDSDGNLFGCSGDGRKIVSINEKGQIYTIVDRLDGLRLNGPNDLAITPDGTIYFSDRIEDITPEMGIDHSSIISVKKINDRYESVRRTFDTTMPNGLLFSKDYKFLYVAQSDYRASEKRELRKYPVNEDGSLGSYEVLHDFGPHRGIDGMTLTDEGLIVACTGWEVSGPGGMITIFEDSGQIIETHPTPALRPTNCTFVNQDLYISSIEGHLLVVRNTGLNGYLLYPSKRGV